MNVLVVDDDLLVTMSLKTILSSDATFEHIYDANNGDDALHLFSLHHPDIILMDIRMEPMNGIEIGQKMLRLNPDAKILYLTTFKDDAYIKEAFKMGARGYLLKQNFDGVINALKAVYYNQNVYFEGIFEVIENVQVSESWNHTDLSQQECLVIELIAQGLNNKEISDKMFLSEGTVRNYISSILSKLDLRDRTQIAIYYYTHIKQKG